jgi:myosin tail region-interacting protein MTI1
LEIASLLISTSKGTISSLYYYQNLQINLLPPQFYIIQPAAMSAPPFKVKASYDYNSPHADDLSFAAGQIVTVTEEEDADWYIGEYTDASGDTQSGLFPKNFVERYEPAPPPRPTRATKAKPTEQPAPEPEPQVAPPIARQNSEPEPEPEPIPEPQVQKPANPLAPKPPSVKSPPPVEKKPSSLRDRIAAFNKVDAAPITPFKPSTLGSSGFIKKPFVAPPPARNAYVPPPREPVQQKVYRREEDPEIAERQAQDLDNAEKAGLVPAGQDDETEEAPKAVSLKERIALLQKQQMEQAARRGDAAKEKPKRPPKKRTDSQEQEDSVARPDIPTSEPIHPDSLDLDREHHESVRKQTRTHKPVEPAFSDGNEADQSAADETTEDAEGGSTGLDEEDESQKPVARGIAPAEEDTAEAEESTEEEEVDEEARHQMALRQRMAKLSGGMGMPGMFGPPGGMPMMGMAGAAPKKKKPTEKKMEQQEESSPLASAPRIPVMPMPGLNRAPAGDSETPVELRRSSTQREHVPDEEAMEAPRSPPIPQGITTRIYSVFPSPPRKVPDSVCHAKSPFRRSYGSEQDAINWILSKPYIPISINARVPKY